MKIYGSDKTNIGNAHSRELDKEHLVVVTRETCSNMVSNLLMFLKMFPVKSLTS